MIVNKFDRAKGFHPNTPILINTYKYILIKNIYFLYAATYVCLHRRVVGDDVFV